MAAISASLKSEIDALQKSLSGLAYDLCRRTQYSLLGSHWVSIRPTAFVKHHCTKYGNFCWAR